MTLSGNRFAYAHRNDSQRRRAFQKVITAYPHNNTKTTWATYFKYIAKERIPFPAGVKAFRPTINWALTTARFGLFLDLRYADHTNNQSQLADAALGAQAVAVHEDVQLH